MMAESTNQWGQHRKNTCYKIIDNTIRIRDVSEEDDILTFKELKEMLEDINSRY